MPLKQKRREFEESLQSSSTVAYDKYKEKRKEVKTVVGSVMKDAMVVRKFIEDLENVREICVYDEEMGVIER